MSELHGGTVTFVFTDIEGSTELLEAARRPVRRGARRAPAHRPRGVRRARRPGARHAGRRVLLLLRARARRGRRGRRRPAGARDARLAGRRRAARPDERPHRRARRRGGGLRRDRRPPRGADLLGRARRPGAALGDDRRARLGRDARRRRPGRARRRAAQGHRRARAGRPARDRRPARLVPAAPRREEEPLDFGERLAQKIQADVERQLERASPGADHEAVKGSTTKLALLGLVPLACSSCWSLLVVVVRSCCCSVPQLTLDGACDELEQRAVERPGGAGGCARTRGGRRARREARSRATSQIASNAGWCAPETTSVGRPSAASARAGSPPPTARARAASTRAALQSGGGSGEGGSKSDPTAARKRAQERLGVVARAVRPELLAAPREGATAGSSSATSSPAARRRSARRGVRRPARPRAARRRRRTSGRRGGRRARGAPRPRRHAPRSRLVGVGVLVDPRDAARTRAARARRAPPRRGCLRRCSRQVARPPTTLPWTRTSRGRAHVTNLADFRFVAGIWLSQAR